MGRPGIPLRRNGAIEAKAYGGARRLNDGKGRKEIGARPKEVTQRHQKATRPGRGAGTAQIGSTSTQPNWSSRRPAATSTNVCVCCLFAPAFESARQSLPPCWNKVEEYSLAQEKSSFLIDVVVKFYIATFKHFFAAKTGIF